MNLIEKFHRKVGVLVKGNIWNRDLPQVKVGNTLYPKKTVKENVR